MVNDLLGDVIFIFYLNFKTCQICLEKKQKGENPPTPYISETNKQY